MISAATSGHFTPQAIAPIKILRVTNPQTVIGVELDGSIWRVYLDGKATEITAATRKEAREIAKSIRRAIWRTGEFECRAK